MTPVLLILASNWQYDARISPSQPQTTWSQRIPSWTTQARQKAPTRPMFQVNVPWRTTPVWSSRFRLGEMRAGVLAFFLGSLFLVLGWFQVGFEGQLSMNVYEGSVTACTSPTQSYHTEGHEQPTILPQTNAQSAN